MRRIKHSLLAWAATATNALASNVTLAIDHDAQPFGRGVLQTSEGVTISPSAPLLGFAVLSTDITITLDQADTFSAAAVLATTETITITPPALLAGIGLLDTDEPITIAGPTGLNAAGLLDSSAGFTLSPPASIDGAGDLSLTTALTLSPSTPLTGVGVLTTNVAVDHGGASFDGAGYYLSRTGWAGSPSDNKLCTCGFWVYLDPGVTGTYRVLMAGSTYGRPLQVAFDGTGKIYLALSSGATTIVSALLSETYFDWEAHLGEWVQVLFSCDASNASKRHLFINGVDYTSDTTWSPYFNLDFMWSHSQSIAIGSRTNGTTQPLYGSAAQFYLTNEYLDLSLSTNRDKFALDVIDDGVDVTGTSPIMMLNGDYTNFEVNAGTGGDFTTHTALTQPPTLSTEVPLSLTLTPPNAVDGVAVLSTTTTLTIAGPTSFAATAVLDTDVTLAFDWSGSDIVDANAATTLSSNVSLIVTSPTSITGTAVLTTTVRHPGAYFDGSTYLSRGAALTGASNTKMFTFACWFRFDTATPNTRFVMQDTSTRFSVQFNSTNSFAFWVRNSAATYIYRLNISGGVFTKASHLGEWHHLVLTADLTDAGKRFIMIDGEFVATGHPTYIVSWTTYTDDLLDFTTASDWYIATNNALTVPMVDNLAQIYFTNEYLDLSNASNRQKLYSGGYVEIAGDGSSITGAAPLILLNSDYDNFGHNSGGGGDFTVAAGSITSPADFGVAQLFTLDVATNLADYASAMQSTTSLTLASPTSIDGAGVFVTDVVIAFDTDSTVLVGNVNALYSHITLVTDTVAAIAGAAVLDTTETLTVTPTVSMSGVAVLDTDETITISVAADVSGAGLLSSTETLTLSPNVDGSAVAVLDTTEALLINFSGNDIALRALLTSIVTVTMDSNADLVAVGPLTSEVRLFLGMYGRAGVNWYNPPRGTLRSVTSVTGTLKEYELVTGTIRDTSIITKRIGSD